MEDISKRTAPLASSGSCRLARLTSFVSIRKRWLPTGMANDRSVVLTMLVACVPTMDLPMMSPSRDTSRDSARRENPALTCLLEYSHRACLPFASAS